MSNNVKSQIKVTFIVGLESKLIADKLANGYTIADIQAEIKHDLSYGFDSKMFRDYEVDSIENIEVGK